VADPLPVDPDRVRAVVTTAAEMAMTAFARAGAGLKVWDKLPGDPVSETDIAIDRFLREELCALLPDAGWLSEETADTAARLDQDPVWLVDPIDGTRDFVRGRTGWAISVALVAGGTPVLGILEAPARGESWLAIRGGGAYCNGAPLRTSDRTMLAGARVPADRLSTVDGDLVAIDKPNSIALRMALVARGDADLLATLHWGYEWDICAAALLAETAGATVSDALGQPLRFNKPHANAFGVLCAAPGIHAAAVERLRDRAEALLRAEGAG